MFDKPPIFWESLIIATFLSVSRSSVELNIIRFCFRALSQEKNLKKKLISHSYGLVELCIKEYSVHGRAEHKGIQCAW